MPPIDTKPTQAINDIRQPITTKSDGKLEAPKNTIVSVSGAQAIYYQYRTEHLPRINLYAGIEGLIAGNPPYPPAELQKAGLLHIANFNNLDAAALYERGALAYWNLLNEVEVLVQFELQALNGFTDDPQLAVWADIMAREFSDVIRRWPSFTTAVNTLAGQLVKFGISPILWDDERDWRWKVIELSRFFVQDQAQSDISLLTVACVESIFTVQYLMEVYNEYKDKPKDKTLWNIEELGRFLIWRANSFFNNQPNSYVDMMDIQRALQNKDLSWNNFFSDGVRLVSMFYQEYDGKISHYIFDRWYSGTEFLYTADRQYEQMQDALVIFTASPGVFTIHSNRGLGHKIYSGSQATMQLDCATVDAARWASTPMLRSGSTITKDFEPIRFYPGVPTHIGSAEFAQNNFGANINQLIGTSQFISQKLNINTANSGDDPGVPDRDKGSISPTEAKFRSYKEFGVLKNNIAHFYSTFDVVVRNMVKKMLNSREGYPGYEYCEEWKERCLSKGVPELFFQEAKKDHLGMPKQFRAVRASRVAGDGSTLARLMGLQELQFIAPDFGPREMREYKRQWILTTMGPQYVPMFLNPADDADSMAGGASLAGVENAIMQNGQMPIFSRDNDQQAHIATHMALANEIIQARQQQKMDPIQADRIFSILIPHTQEHIAVVAQNPFRQKFYEGIKKPWQQIADYARLNRKNAEAQLQAQIRENEQNAQQQQEAMSDAERKDFVVQRDEQRKDVKLAAQMERQREQQAAKAEMGRDKIQKDADNQRLKIELEAQNNAEKNLDERSTEDLRAELESMAGVTPAPADIEPRI